MYSLERIIQQNREAVRAGVMKPGEGVGTADMVICTEELAALAAVMDDCTDSNIYPFGVVGGVDGPLNTWTVLNYATNEKFNTYVAAPYAGACAAAHREARARLAGQNLPVLNTRIVVNGNHYAAE